MTINATAPILLALYVAVAERQGVPRSALAGTTQNDVLKEYIARGTYIFPPGPSLRLITDLVEWCGRELPKWNTISISGYHMREAGATAAQELAFTFSNAIAYVEAAIARGMAVDDVGPRLSFFFAAWTDILEETAKFRAARRIWARVMRDRFGAKNEKSLHCRFHVQTAGSALTAQSIDNNVIRAAYQALAAVLGGAQSLHVNGKDEALALPTEASARLALRTQQVLAHEAGVTGTVDPLGGSWAIEALTDAVETDALALIAETDRLGGAVPAISAGFPQRAIHDAAFAYQREVESGERVIVGVNRFVEEQMSTPPIVRIRWLRLPPSERRAMRPRLPDRLRQSRWPRTDATI
jgi:methylmalonyl-CoA mutase N-terminal domain/subunit